MEYPRSLQLLIQHLMKLPGVGRKNAERLAFHLLEWESSSLKQMGSLLHRIKEELIACPECNHFCDKECTFCLNPLRSQKELCLIAMPRDLYAIERSHVFRGLYHIMPSLLSPLDQKGAAHLKIPQLLARIDERSIEEIIIAFDSTIEGDTTALFLKATLPSRLKISRLALGIPLGSSLEYVDSGTLSRAFLGRQMV